MKQTLPPPPSSRSLHGVGYTPPSPRDGNIFSEGWESFFHESMGPHFPRDAKPLSDGWQPFFSREVVPFPKDGNPFSDGWEPFYRGMGIHFSEGWEGFSEGVGTPLPKGWEPLFRRMHATTIFRRMGPNNAQICPLPSKMHIVKSTLDTGMKKT